MIALWELQQGMAPRPLRQIEAEGHAFTPTRWARGSASPGCECGHDFGHVGGTLAQCREKHRTHLWNIQEEERRAIEEAPPGGYMRSTFEARDLPTVIWIGDEAIAGPFCVHCGWPLSLHGLDLHCRRQAFTWMAPSCKCHGLEPIREMRS